MFLNRILLNIFLFFSFLSCTHSTIQKKTKFCINCKHFINDSMTGKSEFGKCTLFANANRRFLVDGKHNNYDYKYATTAREYSSLCGEEGKHYEKKYKKRITKKEDDLSSSNSFSMIREISDDESNYYE